MINDVVIGSDCYTCYTENENSLQSFRSEYKSHMLAVSALLEAGRNEEAQEYLRRIKAMKAEAGRQFCTGNDVTDSILNYRDSEAKDRNIRLDFLGRVPESGIENNDLRTVFASLIDTALDTASQFAGDRYVQVESNIRNGFVAFTVTAPVSTKIVFNKNSDVWFRNSAASRTSGLSSIETTAGKYKGSMLLSCTDTVFSADVCMKLYH